MSQPEQTITPPTTVSDDTLRRFLGYHMKRAFNVVQADLVATLKPFELRMLTYTALVLICDNPGLSQAQLAAAMDVERPNIVVIVDELERRELINRTRVPTDRRAYALVPRFKGAVCAVRLLQLSRRMKPSSLPGSTVICAPRWLPFYRR